MGTTTSRPPSIRRLGYVLLCVLCINSTPFVIHAQAQKAPAESKPAPGKPEPPGKVEVKPAAQDDEIRERLLGILRATRWYTEPDPTVREGVVFLTGRTEKDQYKTWAADLAQNTEGVVAVVNHIEVVTPTIWDFSPAWAELQALGQGLVRNLPLIIVGLILLAFSWAAGRLLAYLLRGFLQTRVRSQLLQEVAARACGIFIFLLGLYLVLRLAGLTRLAVTVIGGTGLIGLVLGIAFREISENFLASLFLSLQQPFRDGDLVEIAGVTGYVQQLTSRTTVLMTLDGNQVQIPNATVFKSTIRNYSSNPNRREDFVVGIGYKDAIPKAQEIALKVLAEHPAVLSDPEPWVLVDNLAPATVNLRVYFWLDGTQHSWLKVRSSAIRLVKRAFQDAGISLPDEAREIVFPEGVPVHMLDGKPAGDRRPTAESDRHEFEPEVVSTAAEAGLQSEAKEIKQQARQAWSPDKGENLLATEKNGPPDGAGRK